jgi:hypothetical protein
VIKNDICKQHSQINQIALRGVISVYDMDVMCFCMIY